MSVVEVETTVVRWFSDCDDWVTTEVTDAIDGVDSAAEEDDGGAVEVMGAMDVVVVAGIVVLLCKLGLDVDVSGSVVDPPLEVDTLCVLLDMMNMPLLDGDDSSVCCRAGDLSYD